MSHVATIEIEVTNLQDLKVACEELGLELMFGQQTYRWFGRSVGDYPLPEGFTAAELGTCHHACRFPPDRVAQMRAQHLALLKANFKRDYPDQPFPSDDYFEKRVQDPYEIGVVPRRDGKPGWLLLWDFFAGGFGLRGAIGDGAGKLKQAVATAASIRVMKQQGFRVHQEKLANGSVKLQFTR
jgi:hypothetical protein